VRITEQRRPDRGTIGRSSANRDYRMSTYGLKKEYPQINALAQKEKAEIYFGDAAHIRSDHHAGRTWGRRGA
jgi:hypothetical protein